MTFSILATMRSGSRFYWGNTRRFGGVAAPVYGWILDPASIELYPSRVAAQAAINTIEHRPGTVEIVAMSQVDEAAVLGARLEAESRKKPSEQKRMLERKQLRYSTKEVE